MNPLRNLLLVCALCAGGSVMAAESAAALQVHGSVVEVKDTESYTYLLLKDGATQTWVAVERGPVKVGAQVVIENPMEMINFESKALKRTFPRIVFGSIQGVGASSGNPHGNTSVSMSQADVRVAKAKGAQAYTVAEVVKQADALNGKPVEVHARVVKFSPEIMGKNWVHVRDGSGSDSEHSNDILVTTSDSTSVGATVTLRGTVRTQQDFGAGYSYKVLIDGASLKP